MKFNRILLKLSGESLMGNGQYGISEEMLTMYCEQIKQVHQAGVQIAIVIGGGNIYRGLSGSAKGMDRVQGDYMGMLATMINSLAIQGELERQGVKTSLLGGLTIEPFCESFSRKKALQSLEQDKVVIIGGGTGNPFFTTDTASTLRAIEIKADVILKGTRVDGIYSADPEKDKNATKYTSLSFDEALQKKLKVMDLTAFALCQENNLPIYVFDMNKEGNLMKVVSGKEIGTLVK